jgi:hypothetical protein
MKYSGKEILLLWDKGIRKNANQITFPAYIQALLKI